MTIINVFQKLYVKLCQLNLVLQYTIIFIFGTDNLRRTFKRQKGLSRRELLYDNK